MRYLSTHGNSPPASLIEALTRGLAPDGGLYVPEHFPNPALPDAASPDAPVSPDALAAAASATLLQPFVQELSHDELRALLAEALDFPIPLLQVSERIYVLELFHGPTLAFKDVGARVMARLLARLGGTAESTDSNNADCPVTILAATSGDTGGAVADAFHGVAGTRVAVLYPRGKVSALQERQFATLGGNVRAFAVEGTFDDCQRLVKGAFADAELHRRLRLTSANSINLGRLLPQMLYYFHAVTELRRLGKLPLRAEALRFAVPSGNFGNLTAGLYARQLGLPCGRFIAATNANDVVPEYLQAGVYTPRPSVATLSNAMDVGDPSNLARILHLFDRDLDAIRRHVEARRWDDNATRDAIRQLTREHDYIADPHTAVGWLGAQAALQDDEIGIVLATAHPAKFREAVEPLVGHPLDVPDRLAAGLDRPLLSQPLVADSCAFEQALVAW